MDYLFFRRNIQVPTRERKLPLTNFQLNLRNQVYRRHWGQLDDQSGRNLSAPNDLLDSLF